ITPLLRLISLLEDVRTGMSGQQSGTPGVLGAFIPTKSTIVILQKDASAGSIVPRLPTAPRQGKGKGRADDSADYSCDSIRTTMPHEVGDMTPRVKLHAGMRWNAKNSSVYRADGGPGPTPSTLSTPPYPADLSATLLEDTEPDPVISRVAPPTSIEDNGAPLDRASCLGGDDAQSSTSRKLRMEGIQSTRIRRNPWQTMQDHLSSGASGPRYSKPNDKLSSNEQMLEARLPAQENGASSLRGGPLRPEDPSLLGDNVPSLLSRLSDPAPPTANRPHPPPEVPDTAPAVLRAHEDGKRISAPEIMARTRARLARMASTAYQPSSQTLPSSEQHPGAERQSAISHPARGANDVGTVEWHMSSEDPCLPRGATTTARSDAHAHTLATSADPRTLLMQKLAAEKRSAADIPTAEKAQLSSASPSSVPMVLAACSTASGATEGPLQPTPNIVSAERLGERRESELRSQAQLRVRLAAAKKAAHCQQSVAASGDGAGGSTTTHTIDEGLTEQESALRNRLKGRQAGAQM
ncbi:hypothetical protein BC628DRAFT_1322782, partial [Trametes gibbosa]